ncbi:MAG: hypothetical protein H0T76_14030 [Nannocystis sp.]|nr:hypothetical protein [Nannocystis sp.]MBA3547599.1 hypothetical protein [Nannocystis sp.]
MSGRDYILELVERAGEALAMMISGRAADEARHDEADPRANFEAEFGDIHPHLLRVDPGSAALLLRRPWRIRRYALLLIQREAAGGDADAHEAAARRALELLLRAEAIEPRQETELFTALAAIAERSRLEPEALAALRVMGVMGVMGADGGRDGGV